jgi:hypothetical protein
MQPGRRPALSPKSIAFMRAQLGHEPLSIRGDPIKYTLRQHLVRILSWFAVGAFLLLLISAPIVLLFWLFSPYNWTVAWLNSLCICFGCLMLALLPDAAHDAPWKTGVWAIIISLFSVAAYVILNVPQHMAFADTSLGLALGIAAALEGYKRTIPPQRSPVKAVLFALLSMTCFVSVGLALAYYLLPHPFAYEPIIPRFVLWGAFLLLSHNGTHTPHTTKHP